MAKTKKKNPLILPLILLVLIGGLFAVYKLMDQPSSVPGTNTGTEAEVTMILERDVSEVRSISYTYAGETNSFRWNTSLGTWQYEPDTAFPVLQDTVSTMAAAISAIGVYRTLDTGTPVFRWPIRTNSD